MQRFRRRTVSAGAKVPIDANRDPLIHSMTRKRLALPLLIGHRDIVLSLPRCGDAHIRCGAQRRGRRDCPLRLLAWPEQLIEAIAEPCLEHVEFRLGDRHRANSSVTVHASTLRLGGRAIRGQGCHGTEDEVGAAP